MSTPMITERDAMSGMELLAAASTEPELITVFTDEELVGLDGTEAAPLVSLPFITQEQIDAQSYANAATRSLIARGVVLMEETAFENEGEVIAGEPVERAVQIARPFAGLLFLRRTAVAVLAVHRQVSEQMTSLFYHVESDGGVLEELVTADGFHHFRVPTREAAVQRLQTYVDAAEVASADELLFTGPQEELAADQERERMMNDARALSVLSCVDTEGMEQHTLFATSEKMLYLDTGGAMEEPAEVNLREVSAETLHAMLTQLLPAGAADLADAPGEDG